MRSWRVRGVSWIRRIPGIYEKGPKDIKPWRELRGTVLGISDKIVPGPGSAKFFFYSLDTNGISAVFSYWFTLFSLCPLTSSDIV